MLTEEEKREIEEEIRKNERKRAASVEVLKLVQKRRDWISQDDIDELSLTLDMTPAELDGVATFYSLIFRRPVGKHVILVCDSVSCWIMEYERILEHLSARLGIIPGGTTADGRFTLLPVACLGACDRAPAMMVDETLYTELTPEKIDQILDNFREENKQ